MMFPDTSNDQQLAALRRTAERFRAAGNSPDESERATWKPYSSMREGFNSGSACQPNHLASAREERSPSSH